MQTGWKDRMEQWAPEPPAAVWERLSEQLEEKPLYAEKLFEFSAVPPASAWNAIQNKIEPEVVTTPVIRMLPRNKWVQYGSVAASLLFAIFLFRQYSQQDAVSAGTKAAPPIEQSIVTLPGSNNPAPIIPNNNLGRAASRPNQQNPVVQTFYPLVPDAGSDPIPYAQPARIATARLNEIVPANYQVEDGELERYIVLPVSEDAAVRLPKKLYDLFNCGDVPLPAGCSELVLQLRQRVANPSLVTTADFAGVVEMVQRVN